MSGNVTDTKIRWEKAGRFQGNSNMTQQEDDIAQTPLKITQNSGTFFYSIGMVNDSILRRKS